MNYYSVAFFRHPASAYESERCGEARGRFFVNYLRTLVRAHWAVYPDYKLVVFHDEKAQEFPYWRAILAMRERNLLTLEYMGQALTLCGAMAWRMTPIWWPDAEIVLCRDLDALATFRERRSVERWIASDKSIHAMADSISHSSVTLMGGMIGFKAAKVRQKEMPKPPTDLPVHGDDQRWLMAKVYPIFQSDILHEGPAELGPKDHPLEKLGSHIGGAYHVDPTVEWFDKNPSACPVLDVIRECEKAAS